MKLPTKKTPVKTSFKDLSTLIYGPSKIGKSTFCSQADKVIFLATEPGLNALEVWQVPCTSWIDILESGKELASGKHNFDTVVIDTIDNAYKFCAQYVLAKHDVEHEADMPYGKGWAMVNNEFHRVLTKMASMPIGLILISHSTEKEIDTRTGKMIRTVPTLPEKARQIAIGLVDLILYCEMEDDERVIRTKPHKTYDAGDRTGKLPETMPLDYQNFVKFFGKKKQVKSATKSEDI